MDSKTILVTGAAGFIGSSLSGRLMREYPGAKVVGIDSITLRTCLISWTYFRKNWWRQAAPGIHAS